MTEKPEPLFRKEAVRHNTPGLFGEVRLHAPPASWILTGIALTGLGIAAALLFGLEVEGQRLIDWIRAR